MTIYRDLEDMTPIEERAFRLIPAGASRTITNKELAGLLSVPERTIYNVIYRLTTVYGVPVCSSRTGRQQGYFIPTSEEERADGVRPYQSQIATMEKRKQAVMTADIARVMTFKKVSER